VSRFRDRLRKDLRKTSVIYVTAVLTALVMIYLFAALIRPERF
jgi:K+-transporting ATPase KdpF subunit